MIFKKLWNRLVKEKIAKFRQDWVLQFRKKQAEQAKQTGQAKQVEKAEKPKKIEKTGKIWNRFVTEKLIKFKSNWLQKSKKEKFRSSLRYLSFLSALIGVGQLFCCVTFSFIVPYSPFVYILGSIVFSIIEIVMGEINWKKITRGIAWFIGEFFLWGTFLFLFSLYSCSGGEIVRDVSAYDKIVCEWQDDLIAHFPRAIPDEARNVRFYHTPSFLQGGFVLQLRYSCDPLLIAKLYSFYSKMKTKSFMGGNRSDHRGVAGGMPTTNFYTRISGDDTFPKDYEIMLLNKVVKVKGSPGGYWNHGKSRGVAISRKRGVIVYWAESW